MTVLDLRALTTAVFGSGANARTELTSWDAAIRGGLSTTRRVGVVSLSPGAGTSTVAHQLVRAVAARRSEPVLAVDVSSGAPGLAERLGAGSVPPDDTRASARTTAEALSGLEVRDGVVALRPRDADDAVGAWLGEAAPIARFFDVSIKSANEVEYRLLAARDLELMDLDTWQAHSGEAVEIRKMIYAYRNKVLATPRPAKKG